MVASEKGRILPRLITFPPSSDCENGRWTLRHYGIDYREEPHAPPYFFFAIPLNLGTQFPLYVDENRRLSGIREIVDHFDPLASSERRLIPEGMEEDVNRLWDVYNGTMGTATVSWAYYHFLPHREIMLDPLSIGTPDLERWTVKNLYPLPSKLLWFLLGLGRKKADDALAVLKKSFAEVDERLADGRPYLLGERMTLADIAFAVSGAPLVLPVGYGGYPGKQGPLPTFDQSPPEVQSVVSAMRETRAGRFVLRLYAEERYRTPRPVDPLA
ncbi:MAG: glutathione S-transferase C-terminal domain-containing protein [Methylococcaceae bacterium]|nr:glutathione S-transferase C-terminal domain-containing protein [Methylococcaceae bacterium]